MISLKCSAISRVKHKKHSECKWENVLGLQHLRKYFNSFNDFRMKSQIRTKRYLPGPFLPDTSLQWIKEILVYIILISS